MQCQHWELRVRINRKWVAAGLFIPVLIGLAMTFNPKFFSASDIAQNPLAGIFIFFPTGLFTLIAVVQFGRGTLWPAVAFAVGLIVTGLFHLSVAGYSYGNPGYMFPGGHIVAPFVSLAVYLTSFLVGWGVTVLIRRVRESKDQSIEPEKPEVEK